MNQEPNILLPKKHDQGEVIKHEIKKYFNYWYWFVLGVAIALLGAYLYLRYTPKIYSSSAKIKILNKTKGLELPSSAFVFNRSNINLENEIEIIKSYDIIEQVVLALDLTTEFYEEGNVLTTEIDKFPFKFLKTISNESIKTTTNYRIHVEPSGFKVFKDESETAVSIPDFNSYVVQHDLPFEIQFETKAKSQDYLGKTYLLKFIPVSNATKKLKGKVKVAMLGKNSDLLKLTYTSQSRARSERILDTVVSVFNQDGITDRQKVSKRTIDFIEDRFKILVDELDSIESGIKDFKKSNNLITIESDAELGLSQRTISEDEVFDVENQLVISKILEETINSNTPNDLLPSNIGLDNSDINILINQYNDLVLERDKLKASAGINNPTVQVVENKINNVKATINASIAAFQVQLQATKGQLAKKNRKYVNQVASLPLKEKLLRSRERQQAIKQSLYLFLLQKREEAAINLAITEPSIKKVEMAISSGIPISPNSKNIYLMALLGGLLIPFGAIYAYNLLDTKIKGKSDIINRIGDIPILGELPRVKEDHPLFDDPEDRSPQSEAFRILSANVNYILSVTNNDQGKVIYCTSTIKGEGKTYVGINLSLALSSINKKVLLIGADLRNPQIHNYISVDKNALGLSNYLHDETIDWKTLLIKGFNKHPHHDIILSGDIPPNPPQLLTNGRFEQLLKAVKDDYDYIVIDTAPTILVTDTLLVSQYADATIFLLRADYTEKNLLDFSKGLHDSGKLKNMAYVINGVGANKSYGYNYGYNYGYSNKT